MTAPGAAPSQFPSSVHAVVIGAGIHGLSTAWHLAMELRGRRRGSGARRRRARQDRAGRRGLRHRLRLRAQPLHDRAAARDPAPQRRRLEVRPGGFRLPAGGLRLGAARSNQPPTTSGSQEPERRRLSLRPLRRRGGQALPQAHLARLQHRAGRLALHEKPSAATPAPRQAVRRAGREVRPARRAHPSRRRGRRLRRAGRPGHGRCYTDQGRIAVRRGDLGPGRLDAQALGDAGQARQARLPLPRRRVAETKDMWTYWRLLEGEVYDERALRHRRRPEPAGPPRRDCGRRWSTERPPAETISDYMYVYFKNGNERMDRPALQGGTIPVKIGPRPRSPTPTATPTTSTRPTPGSPTTSARPWARLMSRFKGCRRQLPRAPQRRHRRLHARQRAGLRLGRPQRLHDRRLQPRLQDDRRRQAGGPAT